MTNTLNQIFFSSTKIRIFFSATLGIRIFFLEQKQVTDKLYHIMLYTSPWSRFELTTSVVIGTDCIGSCKSNYHTIMVTTALCTRNIKSHDISELWQYISVNGSYNWKEKVSTNSENIFWYFKMISFFMDILL
jgi:hypothetical protein